MRNLNQVVFHRVVNSLQFRWNSGIRMVEITLNYSHSNGIPRNHLIAVAFEIIEQFYNSNYIVASIKTVKADVILLAHTCNGK